MGKPAWVSSKEEPGVTLLRIPNGTYHMGPSRGSLNNNGSGAVSFWSMQRAHNMDVLFSPTVRTEGIPAKQILVPMFPESGLERSAT